MVTISKKELDDYIKHRKKSSVIEEKLDRKIDDIIQTIWHEFGYRKGERVYWWFHGDEDGQFPPNIVGEAVWYEYDAPYYCEGDRSAQSQLSLIEMFPSEYLTLSISDIKKDISNKITMLRDKKKKESEKRKIRREAKKKLKDQALAKIKNVLTDEEFKALGIK